MAGEKISRAKGASKAPDNATFTRATRQALAKLRVDHADHRDSHDDLVSDAHMKCLPLWDGERSYEAFVTWKAGKLALDLFRKEARLTKPVASTADRPLTIAGLRAAVQTECRGRVLRAMGGDEAWFADFTSCSMAAEVADQHAVAKAARKVLAALRGAPPAVTARVDIRALTQYATLLGTPLRRVRQVGGFMYCDPTTKKWRDFGGLLGSDTERAVIALLDGAWPKKAKVGMTAAEVIELEADGIRNA